MNDLPRSAFWDFSLDFYRRHGVAESCLALQDRHALDVNLLLACLWLGAQGRILSRAGLERAMDQVEALHSQVVRPLRAARRALKPLANSEIPLAAPLERLRTRIKALELEAEHLEQLTIEAAMAGVETAAGAVQTACHANVNAYLAALGIQPDGADKSALALLVAAVRS
jgi:uncharacterized protein (TIGR02444 family)